MKPSLTPEQARGLMDHALKTELTDRSVLIPCTGQAFRLGRLKPDKDGQGNELVRVTMAGAQDPSKKKDSVVISVKNAKEMLEKVAAPLRCSKKETAQAKRVPPAPKASALKSTKQKSKEEGSKPKAEPSSRQRIANKISTNHSTQPAQQIPVSFIDIQEEYDSSGRQVRGAAVDISRQLQAVWNHNKEESKEVEGKGEDLGSSDFEIAHDVEEERPKAPPMPTDDEYAAMMQRLEELEMMEEQEATRKTPRAREKLGMEPKSKTKASGGGWNKGFLNSKTKTKTKPKSPAKPKISSDDAESKHTASLSDSSTQPSPKGSVSFGPDDVREIPRIGNTSVKSIPKPKQPSRAIERPISSSVFNGVVHERPATPQPNRTTTTSGGIQERKSRFKQERVAAGVQERISKFRQEHSTAPNEGAPKKRISRFAQERQQQRG